MSSTSNKVSRSLWVYDSLTRTKRLFVPRNGNKVFWYACGPTVYAHAHIGHARAYLTFDIIRRCMQKYFGFDVSFMMNITDIDDKIIKNGRMDALYKNFIETINDDVEKVVNEISSGIAILKQKMEENKNDDGKVEMYEKLILKCNESLKKLSKLSSSKDVAYSNTNLIKISDEAKDAIMSSLDKRLGSTINENEIFSKYAKQYEQSFFEDCQVLNILKPDVITRVTDYCDEVIKFVSNIVDKGMAYSSNGSVYFDINSFLNTSIKDSEEKHTYAKLMPEMRGNMDLLNEGEGELLDQTNEKKNNYDFALWKAHMPGQPSWDSPWGKGRPGWHIECSAMSYSIYGSQLDIHSGGIDLKFPHHDNEIAQCEAHSNSNDWTKYWLHSGHLNISGRKMSKSLKNFISIKDCLKEYSPNTMRMVMMLSSWNKTLDYSEETLERAQSILSKFQNFLKNADSLKLANRNQTLADIPKFEEDELKLYETYIEYKNKLFDSLSDNFDFPEAISVLLELIRISWKYVDTKSNYNIHLICLIADFVDEFLNDVGFLPLIKSTETQSNEHQGFLNLLEVISTFRENVRITAKETKNYEVLKECDKLRDEILPNAGFKLVDSKNGPLISMTEEK